ncbi:MAG: DNA primase [Candidatus Peribacteraceae bacterium]|jgi:DNA primase|nr:DNA primase [Candidatus Peribacteraceae bacterium]MDP7646314.1 DNA primase [Candidatus Peribacteraceae bacterium]|tara:strand:+ start:3335 stop:5086 length:1752 start_codon:yes stop_codon:yes gene_type:complete
MDPVTDIKARLPIEELVGQYCQVKKKGRQFVALCPFHNDTKPSLQISPDKGIAYCFACQTGGDIFSFYQAIEGCDFRQAIKDLAEKTGVTLEGFQKGETVKKDEKDRLKNCLKEVQAFYIKKLKESEIAVKYLKSRKMDPKLAKEFGVGFAPDSFSDTYQHLLKKEFSRKEILDAGLGIQKDLKEGKIYDRFRNRIMFPIIDHRGDIVGFGGRTIGEDDAKYINSSEGPIYNKSRVLYGLYHAKEAIRESKAVVLVEGYFDVIACHQIGVKNTVAVSGTALTEEHAKMLRRYAEKIILCLDQDRAGKDAAERSFMLCKIQELQINSVMLNYKDPDEAANKDPKGLKKSLSDGGMPYMDAVLDDIKKLDVTSAEGKHDGLKRLLPLLDSIKSAVEKEHEMKRSANALGATPSTFKEDLEKFSAQNKLTEASAPLEQGEHKPEIFSRMEIALGLFLIYPEHREYLSELIPPDAGFAKSVYEAIKKIPENTKDISLETLDLPEEEKERTGILLLFCEHHGLTEWSDGLASRELHSNLIRANQETVKRKQKEITALLLIANREGKESDAAALMNQYSQVLKLAKMAN